MSAPYILYGGGVTRSIAVQPLLEEAGLPYELRRVALRRHGRQDWPGHLPSSIDRERQSSAQSRSSMSRSTGCLTTLIAAMARCAFNLAPHLPPLRAPYADGC